MRHLSVLAAGVLAAAVVIGCGPGKELPDDVPKPKEPAPKPPEPTVKIPAASDPEAKAFVDHAIRAFTQNDPARLAKGKVSKSVAAGTVKLRLNPNGALVPVPTDR